ncbi:MAG: hypothetical protein JW997_05835 [Actinobacteria bacterium]|nr:hypothetical protein [Actinomycetota bacterium]
MKKYMQRFFSEKSIIYILFSVFIAVILFSVSAVCNACGAKQDYKESGSGKIDIDRDIGNEDNDSSGYEEKDNGNKEDIKNKEESENSSPGIILKIYEGPLYSEEDDVCFYRVEAIVQGNPVPDLKWSKDDSNGAWGKHKAQVNLTRSNPSYTLKATAANTEGTAVKTIDLSWGCGPAETKNDDDQDGLTEPETEIVSIPVYSDHTGYYIDPENPAIDDVYFEGDSIIIGDAPVTADCAVAAPVSGFLTYEFSSLSGKNVKEASIKFDLDQEMGDVSIFNKLIIMESDGSGWNTMHEIPQEQGGNFILKSSDFTEFMQKRIDDEIFGLELMFRFDPYITDNDADWDAWKYNQSDITFKIEYLK